MIDVKLKSEFKTKINIPFWTVVIMVLLTALTGLFNQNILSMGIIACCAVLLYYDKLYMAYPFMIFYSIFYGVVFGLAVSRIYTFLLLGNELLRFNGKQRIKAKYLPPFLVFFLYIIIVMLPVSVMGVVNVFFEIIGCFIVVSHIVKDEKVLRSFFSAYVIVCLTSFLSGMVAGNTIGDEYHAIRFQATFEDPNYMGFFFTLAVFALITLKLFDKRLRYVMVVVLYAMILTSLSVTAIVVNVIMWVFYLIFMKKLRWSSLVIALVALVILVGLYNVGLENPDIPFVGDFAERIDEKIDSFLMGNVEDVTTNRTDLAQEHLDYFMSLPFLKKLFGGTSVNVRYFDPVLGSAAHNEYVDMLLNVGVIGTLIMFAYFFANFLRYIREYKQSHDVKNLFLIVSKVLWMVYATSLTMFLDYRFLLLFLL